MFEFSTEKLRNLYNYYSPLHSEKDLYDYYVKISSDLKSSQTNIREVYNSLLINNYLNEAAIKAMLVEKKSFKHSPTNTVTIYELNIGPSRADLCMINGVSIVFEIKTAMDNFRRLESQLSNYRKVFEYMFVVIPYDKLNNLNTDIPKDIGILTYRLNKYKKYVFEEFRPALKNLDIDPTFQLQQLTVGELRKISKTGPDSIGDRQMLIKKISSEYSKNNINELYKKILKNKYSKKWRFLYENKKAIKQIDYQWFFKNNVSPSIVYR